MPIVIGEVMGVNYAQFSSSDHCPVTSEHRFLAFGIPLFRSLHGIDIDIDIDIDIANGSDLI
jgi:hypothetical protein